MHFTSVAPLAGSVDRNPSSLTAWLRKFVAPLAGSVDRNSVGIEDATELLESLPSRGAWIEMMMPQTSPRSCRVAPLAGSVDRNKLADWAEGHVPRPSLPSRGAWIEMASMASQSCILTVAPLAGSVDRNHTHKFTTMQPTTRRSPRGERG